MTDDLILQGTALKEIDERRPVPALWAKAYSYAGGDLKRAKARYLKLRVLDLMLERKQRAHGLGAVAIALPKPTLPGGNKRTDATRAHAAWPRLGAAALGLLMAAGAAQWLRTADFGPLAQPTAAPPSVFIEPGYQPAQVHGAIQAVSTAGPNDPQAQTGLGDQFYTGRGVAKNYATAASWYFRAAAQGYAKAQADLAVMYKFGEGVPLDYAKSAAWFRKAADQGDAAAQVNLGVLYAFGQGVAQDDTQSANWFRKAADQGDFRALGYLAAAYETGQGVAQDYVEAYKLWHLALIRTPAWETQLGAEAMKNRDGVAVKMTYAQITEAQRLAREWKPV
jgi:hypothetical protein